MAAATSSNCHIGAQAQRYSAGVLDLKFRNVQFGLIASKKADAGTRLRETDGESLADPTAGAGDQDSGISLKRQRGILSDLFTRIY